MASEAKPEIAAELVRPANGDASGDPLTVAIAYEHAIASEAVEVRDDATELTPVLLMALLELLRRPIPSGFITTTPEVKGKPYASTGVRSVQVLIDRMDNVLTPLWWRDKFTYHDDGKLCEVTIEVGPPSAPLFSRTSWGGVDRGSTAGNVRKGSYTNAAKRALAMVGPGHEVYLGAADFDPDVDPDAAKAQEGVSEQAKAENVSDEQAKNLHVAVDAAGLGDKLPVKLAGFGVAKLTDLTVGQGLELYAWAKDNRVTDG